jgi:F-type H+-transporting ATPase subunit b
MAENVTAGTEVPHDAGHAKVFPPLDPAHFAPQLFWLALTFTALYLLLSRVVLPRIGEVIEERNDRIQADLDTAERLKSDTDAALRNYEKSLADAKAKASGIAKETRDRLSGETGKERAAVEKQLAGKLADAEARIGETKRKALASVDEIAADTVGAIVKLLLGKDVSPNEVKRALQTTARE